MLFSIYFSEIWYISDGHNESLYDFCGNIMKYTRIYRLCWNFDDDNYLMSNV
jgi:hypothetical protein